MNPVIYIAHRVAAEGTGGVYLIVPAGKETLSMTAEYARSLSGALLAAADRSDAAQEEANDAS